MFSKFSSIYYSISLEELFALLLDRKIDQFLEDDVEMGPVEIYFFGPDNRMNNLMSSSANILRDEMKEINKNMARCDKIE